MFSVTGEAYITRQFYSQKPAANEPLGLSLMVSASSFMYAISTNHFRNVVELCHVEITHHSNTAFNITDKLSFLVNNYLLHQKKFEKVNIAFLNNDFTILPAAYSSNADMKELLQFTSGTNQVKNTYQHHLKNLNFCFTLEQEISAFFEKTFPNASIRHAGAINITMLFGQHSLLGSNLFLNIGDGCIELAAKENNDLLFYNVFNFSNNEDILYYLLFAMEQFQLDPLQVKLAIAGERSSSDELIKSIQKYIKQVTFCVMDAGINLNGDLVQLPKHYYFTLLNQHVCEL